LVLLAVVPGIPGTSLILIAIFGELFKVLSVSVPLVVAIGVLFSVGIDSGYWGETRWGK